MHQYLFECVQINKTHMIYLYGTFNSKIKLKHI